MVGVLVAVLRPPPEAPATGGVAASANPDTAEAPGAREGAVDSRHAPVEAVPPVSEGAAATPLAAAVTGRVLDPLGAGVPGERVTLIGPAGGARHAAVTDAAGGYRIDGLSPGGPYRVVVEPKGLYRYWVQGGLRLDSPLVELDIELTALERGYLAGTLLDASGLPVPRFALAARSTGGHRWSAPLVSDATGHFEIAGVPEGSLILESHAPTQISIRGVEVDPASPARVYPIVDWGGHRVRGTVTDLSGKPVRGARLSLTWEQDQGGLRSTSVRHALSDQQGAFEFSDLGPGGHELVIRTTSYRLTRTRIDVGRTYGDLHIVLERS